MRELRVLVVDGEEETRLLSAALLDGRQGVRVCGLARDGVEGLDLAKRQRPDAVVLDLLLPGPDGLDVLRALAALRPRPVAVVTSPIRSPALERLALRLGAGYYAVKPVNYAALPELLRALCRGPLVEAAMARLEDMGAAGRGLEAAAHAAAVLTDGASVPLKEAYAAAMAAQNTSYACVEKNIRAMVERLHRAAGEPYRAMLGGLPPARPANETFLRRLAEELSEM